MISCSILQFSLIGISMINLFPFSRNSSHNRNSPSDLSLSFAPIMLIAIISFPTCGRIYRLLVSPGLDRSARSLFLFSHSKKWIWYGAGYSEHIPILTWYPGWMAFPEKCYIELLLSVWHKRRPDGWLLLARPWLLFFLWRLRIYCCILSIISRFRSIQYCFSDNILPW